MQILLCSNNKFLFFFLFSVMLSVSQVANAQDSDIQEIDIQDSNDHENDVQDSKVEVINLIREAMNAYGNLKLDLAQNSLETALGYAPEITKKILARIYVNYGVLWIGGFADNAKGQQHFIIAKCLDETIQLDPLLSSPDIDTIFNLAQTQKTLELCADELSQIVFQNDAADKKHAPVINPLVPPCGTHDNAQSQHQKTELPLYLQPNLAIANQSTTFVLKYSLNGGTNFTELPMQVVGSGYGAQISCDKGQIRVFDPSMITYYIEGYDENRNLICGHATAKGPFIVTMDPETPPLAGLPGMPFPQECTPCPPWDKTCGSAKGSAGASCYSNEECKTGFACGDAGTCEEVIEPKDPIGPSVFYTNITMGAGFGIMSSEVSYNQVDNTYGTSSQFEIINNTATLSGIAWSGIPLRLALGFNIKPTFAIEVTGRLDMSSLWTVSKNPQNCYDAADGDIDVVHNSNNAVNCTDFAGSPSDGQSAWTEEDAKKSVSITSDNRVINKEDLRIKDAWLVNIRARYRFAINEGLQMSIFGGIGYGHMLYQQKITDLDLDSINDVIFAAPGVFNIEIGPSMTYYFNKHVGIVIEAPIDILIRDGYGVNLELAIGLSFGG